MAADFEFPADFFDPPADRPAWWPDNPDLRRAFDWFNRFLREGDWPRRREAAARRLYEAALGGMPGTDGKGRFFAEEDTFAWYLFLCEAQLDHLHNYEPMFGSRVVPLFTSIGRQLDLLMEIAGAEGRARRLVGPDKRQPNGGLFELLVAAAYRRAGAEVTFIEERKGRERTPDMHVSLNGKTWAVECKRMETGAYGEREREKVRALWGPYARWFADREASVFCEVEFDVELDNVPADYFTPIIGRWLRGGNRPVTWRDRIGTGVIRSLDLGPLRRVLIDDMVLASGTRALELLTGAYVRTSNYVTVIRHSPCDNPRYMDDCDLAVLLRWGSRSEAAIEAKARDIMKKLAEANDQLPADIPGIVHVGFEAVEGDAVERARFRKILATTEGFNPGDKPLEFVYCHYLVPESPPDRSWSYDETTQWCAIRPTGPKPLRDTFLVLDPDAETRRGAHWDTEGQR